jgi:inosine-uridine nucleoside N-ribohydrolase
LHDPLTLATVIAPELLTLKEYYVGVDHSSGVAMGKTFADIFNVTKKPATGAGFSCASGLRRHRSLSNQIRRLCVRQHSISVDAGSKLTS